MIDVARRCALNDQGVQRLGLTRRTLIAGIGALAAASKQATAGDAATLPLKRVLRSPWMANAVALTSQGEMFLGLPRYSDRIATPSLARRAADGSLKPFPGNGWNDWKPGDDGRDAFVYVNAVHVFADDSVWCVDWGAPGINTAFPKELTVPKPGAQKLVRLDPKSGDVLDVLRFGDTILPPGAQMNDLRFKGSVMYITDSGLGAIIVHDMTTGRTLRRLSGRGALMAAKLDKPMTITRGGVTLPLQPPNADLIEISANGAWLYWAAPTGPLYRIATRLLDDPALSDDQLEPHIEHVADIAFSGGSAMDSRGNLYLLETRTQRITLLAASGRKMTLVADPKLMRPDAGFIGRDRRLYVPVKQPSADPGDAAAPFAIYAVDLPESFDGIALGDAVTGKA